MPDRAPHTVPPEPIETTPSRFLGRVEREDPAGCAIGLLGLADDTGVALNGGRPGARIGPAAVRKALARYGVASDRLPRVYDAGDIVPGSSLDDTHERVTAATGWLLAQGLFPVGIGGGHDLTFPFVRAVIAQHGPLTGVYCDPHLDVRAEPGSGMPFRALVERCGVRGLHIRGFNPLVNLPAHVEWFIAHGGRFEGFDASDPWPDEDLFVSFDLDVIDQAFAPGVSATNPRGWSPAQAEAWVRAAGRCPRVRCFDIMELCPPHDAPTGGGQTARLAAHLLLSFLAGYAERGA